MNNIEKIKKLKHFYMTQETTAGPGYREWCNGYIIACDDIIEILEDIQKHDINKCKYCQYKTESHYIQPCVNCINFSNYEPRKVLDPTTGKWI